MNVSLTVELEKAVQARVDSGMYQTASEVVREGLRLLLERDKARDLRLDELRAEVRKGVEQLDRGEGIRVTDARAHSERVKARGRQRLSSVRSGR